MDKMMAMNQLIAGIIAFYAVLMLFDLLRRGKANLAPNSKPPRDLVHAQGSFAVAFVLGGAVVFKLLPFPVLTLVLAAVTAFYGLQQRRKLTLPQPPKSVVVKGG